MPCSTCSCNHLCCGATNLLRSHRAQAGRAHNRKGPQRAAAAGRATCKGALAGFVCDRWTFRLSFLGLQTGGCTGRWHTLGATQTRLLRFPEDVIAASESDGGPRFAYKPPSAQGQAQHGPLGLCMRGRLGPRSPLTGGWTQAASSKDAGRDARPRASVLCGGRQGPAHQGHPRPPQRARVRQGEAAGAAPGRGGGRRNKLAPNQRAQAPWGAGSPPSSRGRPDMENARGPGRPARHPGRRSPRISGLEAGGCRRWQHPRTLQHTEDMPMCPSARRPAPGCSCHRRCLSPRRRRRQAERSRRTLAR